MPCNNPDCYSCQMLRGVNEQRRKTRKNTGDKPRDGKDGDKGKEVTGRSRVSEG